MRKKKSQNSITKKPVKIIKKTKVVRSSRVPKTRNAGTQTEASFWSFIRAALRQKSRYWKPILKCKLAARRDYTGINKRQRFEYLCASCGRYFPEKEINVDHIIAAGSLKCGADLEGFIERLFCEEEGLQVLCEKCHTIKTEQDLKTLKVA